MLFSRLIEVLDLEPHPAPLNMAIDEALLRAVEFPTLRIYRWQQPAVSFGYFGKVGDAEALAAGREMVRRWTGGGMVEHGDDVTYTLLVPRGHPFGEGRAPDSYRMIHGAIAGLLQSAGNEVQVTQGSAAKISDACFANPVPYDLVTTGGKLAGAAQRRTRWGLLHQGSIQAADLPDQWASKLADAFSAEVQRQEITPEILDAAYHLVRVRYGTVAWLRKF